MSGTTTHFGLHYGTIDDATSGLLSTQQLATDVDGALLRFDAGLTNMTPVANTPTSVAVTFATAFSTVPHVVACANTSSPGVAVQGVGVLNVSTTGFTLVVTRTDTNATSVQWMALARS